MTELFVQPLAISQDKVWSGGLPINSACIRAPVTALEDGFQDRVESSGSSYLENWMRRGWLVLISRTVPRSSRDLLLYHRLGLIEFDRFETLNAHVP